MLKFYINDLCLCLVILITDKVTVIHCITNIIIYVPIDKIEVLSLRDFFVY